MFEKTWNTNKNAIITLPDKTEKSINKETSFSEVGKYKVKIGKILRIMINTSIRISNIFFDFLFFLIIPHFI